MKANKYGSFEHGPYAGTRVSAARLYRLWCATLAKNAVRGTRDNNLVARIVKMEREK